MISFTSKQRKTLSIASNHEELEEFAQRAQVCGQKGYPVLLIPFGFGESENVEMWERCEDEGDLRRCADALLHPITGGIGGHVHVLKAWPMPK